MAHSDTLTPRQTRFVTALLTAPTVEAAARSSGIALRTARRWVQLPVIRAELQQAQREMLNQASRRAVASMVAALETLEAIHRNGDSAAGARVAAARAILEAGPKLIDLTDLEERLAVLEHEIGGKR